MAIEKSVKEEYLNLLTQNYMDKLFYFCLKKTGNSFEAENLTSDILLNIITSLERGNKPEIFEAWVWSIARNRYSVWARNKNNRNELFANNRNYVDFSESEKAVWKGIENRFAHLDENGNIISDILVLAGDTKQKCIDILQSHPLAQKLTENFKSAFDETIKILKKYSHPILEKQLTYCASMVILNTRMMTVHDEILANKLIVPKKPKESTIAMWIEYK